MISIITIPGLTENMSVEKRTISSIQESIIHKKLITDTVLQTFSLRSEKIKQTFFSHNQN